MAKLKKLHRSRNHRMIAGVMGGVAEYFGWSPNLTRILLFIISSASAAVSGFLIYLFLCLIMSKAIADSYV